MSNLRQAAQQALEALELLARYEHPLTKVQVRKPRDGGPIVTVYPQKVALEAITAMRAALAEPEQPHDFLCVCGAEWDIYPDGREELVATPDSANRSTDSAEPFCNQEPVAEIVQAFADLKAVSFCGEMPPVGTKLFTAPTPRKPFTDWDIDRVTDQQWAQHNHKPIYAAHRAYARAVIAAYEQKQGEQHE